MFILSVICNLQECQPNSKGKQLPTAVAPCPLFPFSFFTAN
jgi:hypothetical protein